MFQTVHLEENILGNVQWRIHVSYIDSQWTEMLWRTLFTYVSL